MVRKRSLVCVLLATGACHDAESGASASVTGSKPRAREAVLFFTSELSGQVEPCGCRSRPLGGIQRIAAVVDRPGAAWIDTGDYLFPPRLPDHEADQHELKAHHLARIFREAGGIALNVGPADAQLGGAFLRSLQQEGALPMVSANVRPVGEGSPAVARSLSRKVGDLRVGITGIATPEALGSPEDFAALEYGPALATEVEVLREAGADVVVVLAQLERVHALRLASAVSGIDLILHGSRPDDGWDEPSNTVRVGRTVVVDGGFKGRYVGRVGLALPSAPTDAPLRLRDPDRQRRLEVRVETYRSELRRLQARGASDDVLAPRRARLDEAARELAATRARAARPPWVEVTRLPIEQELPAHPDAAQALEAYHAELVRLNWKAGDDGPCRLEEGGASYVGSEACADCHPEAYAFWKNTPHAHAWATLVEREKQGDLTCIGCHSVGYRQPGGFCRLSNVGLLRDVGCESCHGPGSLHLMLGDPDAISRGLGERTCAGECHVTEHSDQFHYGTYLQVVTGPGHPLTSRDP